MISVMTNQGYMKVLSICNEQTLCPGLGRRFEECLREESILSSLRADRVSDGRRMKEKAYFNVRYND